MSNQFYVMYAMYKHIHNLLDVIATLGLHFRSKMGIFKSQHHPTKENG